MVDDVQHGIRLPALDAVFDRRQIGRGVEKRAVLLADKHRRFLAGQEDAERAVALARQALPFKVLGDLGQAIVIKTLAERFVERHVQPSIRFFQRLQARRHKLPPELQVLFVARMKLGRFFQSRGTDPRMRGDEFGDRRIGVHRGELLLQLGDGLGRRLGIALRLLQGLRVLLVDVLVARRCKGLRCGKRGLRCFRLLSQLRQFGLPFEIADELIHQPIEP